MKEGSFVLQVAYHENGILLLIDNLDLSIQLLMNFDSTGTLFIRTSHLFRKLCNKGRFNINYYFCNAMASESLRILTGREEIY